jgi:pyruvate dehydrogenase (quinone)
VAATVSDFLVERLRAWGSYAAYAELLGFKGIVVSDPDEVADALDAALASDCPVVLEAIVDPNVPRLPPHITLEQARNYLKAILKGDPDAVRIVKASLREMLA